ncbi:hypothetical protein ACS0TY_022856 [Phlomoides rotata]
MPPLSGEAGPDLWKQANQGECLCYREVTSYSFIDDSHFFLETTLGSFSLDLEKKEWTCLGTDVFPPAVGYFVTAGKGQCAATSGAAFTLGKYGFENPDLGCGPPLAESTFAAPNTPDWEPDWEPEFPAPSIVPLHPTITQAEDGGGDVCNTCVLRVEKDPPNQNENGARILMDLCHTGVTTLMSTVSKKILKYMAKSDNIHPLVWDNGTGMLKMNKFDPKLVNWNWNPNQLYLLWMTQNYPVSNAYVPQSEIEVSDAETVGAAITEKFFPNLMTVG